MSAFDTAIRRVMTIPKEVLKQAFMPKRYDPTRQARFYDNTIPLSLEASIQDQIIAKRVMPDINLVSGTEVPIHLRDAQQELLDQFNTIYRFSDEVTGGRTIISPIEVTYGYANNSLIGTYGGYGNYSSRSSILLKSARDVLRSASGTPMQSTAYVQLIGHNTILVNDVTPIQNYGVLRCIVTNDPQLNNLRPQYHQRFATLVLHAAKSYIYSQLVIDIDEGQLRGGQTIGRFREVVDGYANDEDMYIEELVKWTKVGYMNDPTQFRKIERMAIGNRPKY